MNPSRNSYTSPVDYNQAISKYVILSPCEFCQRTFLPDSLVKHRKVCYKDYLKKKSQGSKKTNMSRSKSAQNNCGDLPGMSCSELMVKRQIRRMHWRGRHEEFIQSIREAREYAISANSGIKIPPSNISLDLKENMQQCKYCLRNFQKDSFEKHLKRCKEYSIKSLRCKPNDNQIEAKRRLSLRLYYKPKSFRGDSPDDLSTTVSSNDFDCQSSATIDSQNNLNRKSRASSYISICGNAKTKKQSGISIPKSQASVLKRHKSSAFRESTESPSIKYSDPKFKCNSKLKESQSQGSLNKNRIAFGKKDDFDLYKTIKTIETQKPIIRGKSLHRIVDDDYESFDSIQFNRSNKNNLKSDSVNHKLKVISNILNSSGNYRNSTPRNLYGSEIQSNCDLPNPAESLRKAKEILKFLDIRMQENELYSQNFNSNLVKDLLIHEDQVKSNYKDPFEGYFEGQNSIENRENSPPPHNNSYKIDASTNNIGIRTGGKHEPFDITKKPENKCENFYQNVKVNETANLDLCKSNEVLF